MADLQHQDQNEEGVEDIKKIYEEMRVKVIKFHRDPAFIGGDGGILSG